MKKRTSFSSAFLAVLFAVLLAPALSAWEPAENVLGAILLFSTPVLFFFFFIYLIALVDSSRMNRMLAISSCIFIINLVVQALLAVFAWGHSQGG